MSPRGEYYLPQRQLVSQNEASMIQSADVPRSRFLGQWQHLTTFDAGYLIPFMCEEILPGDHVSYDISAYVRMATPLFPLFSNQRIDTHVFYTPSRICWTNWVRMMGEQDDPDSSIDYDVPIITSPVGGHVAGDIFDHFGIPIGVDDCEINVLPLRAYNRIYNEWFRDQNLIDSAPMRTGDDGDLLSDYVLRRRAKSHDYFTSLLPAPQKFGPTTIPLGGQAPVIGIGFPGGFTPTANVAVLETGGGALNYPFAHTDLSVAPIAGTGPIAVRASQGTTPGDAPLVFADLAEASGITINMLRQAFLIQQLNERDQRGGTRYTEILFSHFRVRSPDARLQRPEYIGGGQSPLNITPIAQTAPSTGATVGALGAAATATGTHRASYAATEHGYIIGLISVKSELAYQQGLHKMWSRRTRYDFYWPALAGLGEQAVLMKEIYMNGNPANDDLVFGYQERWHEYRTNYSQVTGIFRSGAPGTLDAWHLAQAFGAPPTLNQTFIEDTPPMARVLAAGELAELQQYLADIHIKRTIVRAMPVYGTPVLLGRF